MTWQRLTGHLAVAVAVAVAVLLTPLPAAGEEAAPRLAFTRGAAPGEISVLQPDWSHRVIVPDRSTFVEERWPTSPVPTGSSMNTAPVWSPDGRRITYVVVDVTGSRIRTVRVDGRRDKLVATLPGHYAWEFDRAPADGWMAVVAGEPCLVWGCPAVPKLFLVSPDGTLIMTLGPAQGATWAPRGSRLAYTVGGRILVVEVGAAGPSAPRDVTPEGLSASEFVGVTWSPQGDRLAFGGWPDRNVRSSAPDVRQGVRSSTGPWIWTVDADGGNARPLPASTRWWGPGLSWSPDGRWIAYADSGLHAVATDGTVTRTIVDDPRVFGPVWSPDGRWIAFKRQEQACCRYPLAVVHPDGTGLRRVAWTVGGAEVGFAPLP